MKSLLSILCLLGIGYLCSAQVLKTTAAQPFNHKIPGLNYQQGSDGSGNSIGRHKQTITHDDAQNIFFLSTNDSTQLQLKEIEIIKLNPTGTFNKAIRLLNNSHDHNFMLYPRSIIHTHDDGILLIGQYVGDSWLGYPITGTTINTIFYAKFDNNLTLISFKIHHGYPLSINPNSIITCDAITTLPATQEYIILGNTGTDVSLIKLDINLNPVQEKHIPYPISNNLSPMVINGVTISYLPNNNVLAITAETYNDDIQAYTYSGVGPGWFPSILTIDPNLNVLTPLTMVHFANSDEQVLNPSGCSLHYYMEPTNAIEDYSDINNVIWGFEIGSNGGCGGNGCFILKNDVTTLNAVTNQVYSTCDASEIPIEIYNNPFDENLFTVGLTESIDYPNWGAPGPPAGFTTMNCLNVKPALLNINYGSMTPNNLYRYNLTDYSLWEDPLNGYGHNVNRLESFNTFFGNLSDPSFIMHVTNYSGSPSYYTRIINAQYNGYSNCSFEQEVYSTGLDPAIYQYEINADESDVEAIEIFPDTVYIRYTIDPCTQPAPKFTGNNSNNEIKVYPNPVTGNKMYIEGDFNPENSVILQDLMGRNIAVNFALQSNKIILTIPQLAAGVYTLKVFERNSLMRIEKIVVN